MMGFGSEEEWVRFNRNFPLFVEKYQALEDLRNKIFQRDGEGDKIDRVIFALGRVCSEDFQQALLLCGNGFGIGALQMIRGMYEREVTAVYLAKNPDKVDDFLDYHSVQIRKGMNHLKRVTKDEALERMIPKKLQESIEADYKTVKDKFLETICENCNLTKPMGSWTKLATPDLAFKADVELANLYFYDYFRPTMYSHSTVSSLIARLRKGEQDQFLFDNEGQKSHVKEALIGAHALLLHVLDFQNEHFKLGLDDGLKQLSRDFEECWRGFIPPIEPQPD